MKRRGFTLIELMVVIAIIGLLAAVALPRFAGVSDSAKVANVQGNISSLRTSIAMYHSRNDAYPDLVGNHDDLTAVNNTSTGVAATDNFTAFFGKNVAPETPAETGLTNTLNAFEEVTSNGNIIEGNGLGGWAYVTTSGDIRANLADGTYNDSTDWTQF